MSAMRATLLLSLAIGAALVACGRSPTSPEAEAQRLLDTLEDEATGEDRRFPYDGWPPGIRIEDFVLDPPDLGGPPAPTLPAVQALADAGASLVTALTAYLLSEERSVLGRRLALQGVRLGRLHSASIVDSLHVLATHADDGLASDAHLTVARIEPYSGRTRQLVDRSWNSPREAVRAGAARAVPLLDRTGRDQFAPRLIARLEEICLHFETVAGADAGRDPMRGAYWDEPYAVLRAVSGLGAEASPALESIVRMARVADSLPLGFPGRLAGELAAALGAIETDEALHEMRALAARRSWTARIVAVGAVETASHPASERAAILALVLGAGDDLDFHEVRAYMHSLRQLGEEGRTAEPAVRRLTAHPDPAAAHLARAWLERMGLDE